jgi:hypothetical protein
MSPRERRDQLLMAAAPLRRVRHPNRRTGPAPRGAIRRAKRLHPGKAAP